MSRKTVLLLILGVCCLAGVSCSTPSDPRLVGTWETVDELGVPLRLVFRPDRSVELQSDGQEGSGSYDADTSKKPHELDIEWEGVGLVETLYELVDKNQLRMANNVSGKKRPRGFNRGTRVFKRVEDR